MYIERKQKIYLTNKEVSKAITDRSVDDNAEIFNGIKVGMKRHKHNDYQSSCKLIADGLNKNGRAFFKDVASKIK